jgi:hypothetical protein
VDNNIPSVLTGFIRKKKPFIYSPFGNCHYEGFRIA